MKRIAISAILLAWGLSLAAQSVTLVSPGVMRFNDPNFGVSFRYPAAWTFADDEPFYIPLSISLSDSSSQSRPRALVFAKSLPGVESTHTTFAGVGFGYDAHQVASSDACKGLARSGDNPDGKIDQKTIHGIAYWHGTSASAGLGHGIEEDIYTTLAGNSAETCLRFDLAVQSVNIADETPPRALSPRETGIVHQSLLRVLSSVRIPAPTR
jgi:hypothetical protein